MDQSGAQPNILLLTYDSCRFDVLSTASTPALDSYVTIRPAQSPATFTYPSHLAFFAGILPNCIEDVPLYNRFSRQLLGLTGVGETEVVKSSHLAFKSEVDLVAGLRTSGYQTIGAGAMNWFRQLPLTREFEHFRFTGTDADAQIDFVIDTIDPAQPFFAFINFGETHAPFSFKGKQDRCPVDVRARIMSWPPIASSGPVGKENPAFEHQQRAAEFLDSRLPRLFSSIPTNTIVIVCADHGECFGEDGYWGHGISHPKVWEVPLGIFRLDGESLEPT